MNTEAAEEKNYDKADNSSLESAVLQDRIRHVLEVSSQVGLDRQ